MTYLKGIVFKMLTFCLLVFVHKQEGELSLGYCSYMIFSFKNF